MASKGYSIWILGCVCLIGGSSLADDTELYVFESSARSGVRPQVLIIFDNSGSMSNEETTEEFYPRGDILNDSTKLYYSHSTANVPALNDPRNFLQSINGCASARQYLRDYGIFTGFIREYSFSGQSGIWRELPIAGSGNIGILDCFEDIDAADYQNATGQGSGFPVDGLGDSNNPTPYNQVNASSSNTEITSALEAAKLTGFGTGRPVTLYTEKYINWYHSQKSTVEKSRLEIAKRVMEDTVVTTPGVDFGLAIFNLNYPNEGDRDGGRIISGIRNMDKTNKSSLLTSISSLPAETNTPLCETLYEAYRYFSGQEIYYADDDTDFSHWYQANTPARDVSIESNGKYLSPFKSCQNRAYVVLITDGKPTLDRNADLKIKALSGADHNAYQDNYLTSLTGWMNSHDINSDLPDDQHITTFTIGFSEGANDAAPLLTKAAEAGGGQYFAAQNASQLQTALQQVFSQILEVNASFTSPSIASNNFDRTRTFDAVYYAMFLPSKGPRWAGNLKKFKVTGSGDVVDKNNNPAIGTNGSIKSSACSYWTSNAICSLASNGGDGNDVTIGGAAAMLQNSPGRTLYGDFSADGQSLLAFSANNAAIRAGNTAALASYMGVTESQLPELFNWASGVDIDDDNDNGDYSDRRVDIMGDPLHSKPLAINFGTPDAPDVRILLGTNHGFLHMFKDSGDSVTESWAFMPYELLPNLQELKANLPTGVHSVYGLDSSPVAYVKTGASGVEKAWLFMGMRRGGKSYYALDISNPDAPQMMWHIDSSDTDMTELAQTWAEPVITLIPGWPAANTNADTARPVLIFGAGYSPSTKDSTQVGTEDTQGRGVFILDAETGELVHSFEPRIAANTTQIIGITDSIPNAVAVLDSNGDRLSDRIYATDTGANVWRMDLPTADPKDSQRPWTAFKFAELGGDTLATDRRFFAEPVVAQTMLTSLNQVSMIVNGVPISSKTYQSIPYDAVVVGSGHRPSPTDKNRADMFFVLQDRNVVTRSFNEISAVPAPLKLDDLYPVTSNAPVSEEEQVLFGEKRGWYYDFTGVGEKTLSAAVIVQGRVYFTSYLPGDISAANACLVAGQGRLYGFDLHTGVRSYTKEYLEIGERVPDTPQLVAPPREQGDSSMYLIGIGNAGSEMIPTKAISGCSSGDGKCIGGGLKARRIYYHVVE